MAEAKRSPDLIDRFPALRRLRARRGARIPYVQQTTNTDCGAACLTMVLAYFGKRIPVEEVRQVANVDASGASAYSLLQAGRTFGLRGRGVKVDDPTDLQHLSRGAILHWRFHHFVVFDGLRGGKVVIVDPGIGRRAVGAEELGSAFTGVALELEPSEAFVPESRRRRGLGRMLHQIGTQRATLTKILTVSALIQILALGLPILTGVIVDRVVPRSDRHLLMILAIGLALVVAFRFLCSLLRAFLLVHMRTRLDARLTFDFLDHLVDLPLSFFNQRSAGDLMLRVESNTSIRELLTSSTLSVILDGTMVSLYVVLLMFGHFQLGLLVLGLALARIAVFVLSRRRHRDLMSQALQTRADTRGHQIQILTGIETLKASGSEARALERWSHRYVDELNVTLDQGRLNARVDAALDALAVGSPLIVLLAGAHWVLQGDLTLGTMLALSALAAGVLMPLSTLITTAFDLQRILSYLERINDVLDTRPEQDRSEVERPQDPSGHIEVRNLTFRYGAQLPAVLDDVSVIVKPGQMVAVVGQSGSGKSTLAALLIGLYPPTSGQVLYDGQDLSRVDLRTLRSRIGVVMQDPYLFGISIRDNIALNHPGAPLREVVAAARLAEIHDDIMALPMGYNTILADAGASLSGGQRQRLAIARALFHRPKVLIFDEATSALDTITERRIHRQLSTLRATRVVIAHRLSTVVDADLILVMQRGRLIEQGDHESLIAAGGHYAELVGGHLDDGASGRSSAGG